MTLDHDPLLPAITTLCDGSQSDPNRAKPSEQDPNPHRSQVDRRVAQWPPFSELDPTFKRDHAWRAVTSQSHAEQRCRRRDCAFQGAELGRDVLARNTCLHAAGQRKIGVVEGVEQLHIEAERSPLPERKLAREVNVRVRKVRPAHRVAAGVAELAIGFRIASGALPGGGIDDRNKGIGIEPLTGSSHSHSWERCFAIKRLTRSSPRELRPARLEDPFSISRVRLAQDAEWQAG